MSATSIEWTDVTWNPSQAMQAPFRWKKPRRVFVNSMSDLFYGDEKDRAAAQAAGKTFQPVSFEFIDQVFAVMALTPQHTYQIFTKRPERMAEYALSRTAIDDSGRYDRAPQWYQQITQWLDDSFGGGRCFRTGHEWDVAHAAAEKLDLNSPLPNVWLGTSCENQAAADERIPHLLNCHAAVRFLSCEPLLGPIDLRDWLGNGIHWVITGGES